MNPARRALLLSFAENYARFIINFIVMLILARLLTPAQIGAFSIAYSLATLGHTFRELGVSHYVISERELTTDRLRSALTVSIGMAWLMAMILALASPWIGRFYRDESVGSVALVLGLNFLMVPFGAVTLAVLKRNLQFGRIFIINFVSGLMGSIASVVMAAAGSGAMSLAWGSTIGLLGSIILAAIYRPAELPWLPGRRELRRVLSFGSVVTVGSSMHAISATAPDLVIGKALGATETGLFSKAMGLVDTFNKLVLLSIWNFSLAHFSAQIRDGEDPRPTYLTAVKMITGLAWPFFAVLALAAKPVILMLLGDQWVAAAPVASVLCISAAISAAFSPYANLALANNGAKAYANFFSIMAALRVVAVLIAAPFGLVMVASSLAVASVIGCVPAVIALRKTFQITLRDIIGASTSSLIVTIASAVPPALVILAWRNQSLWIEVPALTAAATIGWLAGLRLTRHAIWDELLMGVGAIKRFALRRRG